MLLSWISTFIQSLPSWSGKWKDNIFNDIIFFVTTKFNPFRWYISIWYYLHILLETNNKSIKIVKRGMF